MALLIDNAAVDRVIDIGDVIETLDTAYRANAAGAYASAPRLDFQSLEAADGTAYQLGLSIGLGPRYACIRVKSDMVLQELVGGQRRKQKYCVAPGSYMGLLLVFDVTCGALRAIVHDGLIQRMRVAADSALGVRYMARTDARRLGILGAGGMAGAHIEAIARVRKLESVRLYSPTEANRTALARDASDRLGLPVEAVASPEDVFEDTDMLAACTNAVGPVVPGRLLRPGMHVTSIGGTLDDDASRRVDRALRFGTAGGPVELPDWEFEDECATFAQGGRKSGHGGTRRFHDIPRDRRVMFADLLSDPLRGRSDDEQITFSERGNIHGVQFAALAGLIWERARDAGLGTELSDALFLQSIRN